MATTTSGWSRRSSRSCRWPPALIPGPWFLWPCSETEPKWSARSDRTLCSSGRTWRTPAKTTRTCCWASSSAACPASTTSTLFTISRHVLYSLYLEHIIYFLPSTSVWGSHRLFIINFYSPHAGQALGVRALTANPTTNWKRQLPTDRTNLLPRSQRHGEIFIRHFHVEY